ncbi:hypothetical protein PIB30_046762, partial [Stylosanthes scabra]|nr:hypothetical protein [Stylosanthes scabra]
MPRLDVVGSQKELGATKKKGNKGEAADKRHNKSMPMMTTTQNKGKEVDDARKGVKTHAPIVEAKDSQRTLAATQQQRFCHICTIGRTVEPSYRTAGKYKRESHGYNWLAVPQAAKDFMWKYVNTKFILPLSCEKWVIQSARDAWKRFKGKLKRRHFVPYDNIEDMVKNRPLQVPGNQFIKLILYWSHPTIQALSQKNKHHKAQQKFPHRMEPINFGRVRAALRATSRTNEEPKRFEIFIATHTSQKRKELDEETQSVIHQEEVQSLKGELGDVREEVHGLRNMVKLLLQCSEPGMSPEEIEAMLKNPQHSPVDANSGHGSTHIPNINM